MKKVWGMKRVFSLILLTTVLLTSDFSDLKLISQVQTAHAATTQTKIDKPVISSVDNAYNGVVVTWNKVKNAEGYVIYRRRKSTEKWTLLKKVSASKKRKYVDKDAMKEGGLYTYMIKAYKGSLVSDESEIKTITRITITKAEFKVEYGQREAREMLKMINDLRTGSENWAWNNANNTKTYVSGLNRLVYDYSLEKCAMIRAAELAVNFAHERPNGKGCFSALNDRSYVYTAAAENIARGFTTAKDAFTAIAGATKQYEGQEQRRVMLSADYNVCAIGHAKVNGVDYWVQFFAMTTDDSDYTKSNNKKTKISMEIASEDIPYYDEKLQELGAKYKDCKPSKVVLQSAKRYKKQIELTFTRSTGAQGYAIYRSNKKKSGFKRIKRFNGQDKLTWKDTKVASNKKYYYYVVPYRIAHDTYIYGKKSNVVMVKAR